LYNVNLYHLRDICNSTECILFLCICRKSNIHAKKATIKSSVLLEFNGLSITIINLGGLFALKVGHHHQHHTIANKTIRQQTIASLACTLVGERWLGVHGRECYPSSFAFCAHGNRSEIEFGPCAAARIAGSSYFCATNQLTPLLLLNLIHPCAPPSQLRWENLVSAPRCHSSIFLSLFSAVGRILLLNTRLIRGSINMSLNNNTASFITHT
jgi:hypothetical protein